MHTRAIPVRTPCLHMWIPCTRHVTRALVTPTETGYLPAVRILWLAASPAVSAIKRRWWRCRESELGGRFRRRFQSRRCQTTCGQCCIVGTTMLFFCTPIHQLHIILSISSSSGASQGENPSELPDVCRPPGGSQMSWVPGVPRT